MKFNYHKMLFLLFLCIYFVFCSGNATAESIIVDSSGNGNYTSIQDAVDVASEGATIVVRNGIYIENIDVDRSLTIVSESGTPEDVIVKPLDAESNLIAINADNVTISGFTVIGANSSKAIFLYESTDCLIENNIVESNKYGIYLNNSDNNEVVSNTLQSNELIGLCLFESNNNTVSSTLSLNDLIGFDLVSSCNNVLSDNSFEDDEVYGIYFHEFSHGNSIVNNTIDHTYYFEPLGSVTLSWDSIDPVIPDYAKEFELYTIECFDQGSISELSVTDPLLASTVNAEAGVASGIGVFLNKHSTGNLIASNIVENSFIYGIYFGNGSSGNTIYDNYFNNTDNFNQYFNNTNTWNITKTAGTNIAGGSYLGGNCWTNPSGTDFSQTHPDMDEDGICDETYAIEGSNIDHLPLLAFIPNASIISVAPSPAYYSEPVTFNGTGSPSNGSIIAYSWYSSIDGQLSTNASFTTSGLSLGNHTIYFRVQESDGDWSVEDVEILTVRYGLPSPGSSSYFASAVYSGLDLPSIVSNFGIDVFDSHTVSFLKCLEFNASNFAGFSHDPDDNASLEVLRIYEDENLTGRTIPADSLEYRTTIYLADFNATFDDYLYDGYPALDMFGERYVPLNVDSPDMLVKLVIDSDEVITLLPGESVDLGNGFTFNLEQIDVEGDRAWMELDRFGEFVEDKIVTQSGSDSATWWYDCDVAYEDDVIVFGVHVQDINSSSITIDGLWLVDFEQVFEIKSGDEFGNLEVDSIDSESVSMRNNVPLVLESGATVGIASDLSFEVVNTTNLSFQLVMGPQNGSVPNVVPTATIVSQPPYLVFQGDRISLKEVVLILMEG